MGKSLKDSDPTGTGWSMDVFGDAAETQDELDEDVKGRLSDVQSDVLIEWLDDQGVEATGRAYALRAIENEFADRVDDIIKYADVLAERELESDMESRAVDEEVAVEAADEVDHALSSPANEPGRTRKKRWRPSKSTKSGRSKQRKGNTRRRKPTGTRGSARSNRDNHPVTAAESIADDVRFAELFDSFHDHLMNEEFRKAHLVGSDTTRRSYRPPLEVNALADEVGEVTGLGKIRVMRAALNTLAEFGRLPRDLLVLVRRHEQADEFQRKSERPAVEVHVEQDAIDTLEALISTLSLTTTDVGTAAALLAAGAILGDDMTTVET